ncbi:MAG: hypothetical protein ABI721_02900 [Candidatus Dojkabacteria bacterium]
MNELLAIVIIAVAILGGIFVYMLLTPQHADAEWKIKAKTNLNKIRGLTTAKEEMILKNAVFEADKLLDFVLKSKKVKGETLGERLKNAKHLFRNNTSYNTIWEVHKLRNKLAHEMDYSPNSNFLRNSANSLLSEISDII